MTALRMWVDGQLFDQSAVGISPMANTLHYGTGVFEGIRCYATPEGPRVFRLADHMARMARGAARLAMDFDPAFVSRGVGEALTANGLQNAYIRPVSYYESGGIGLDLGPLQGRHLVLAMPWQTHLGAESQRAGISLFTSSIRRTPAACVPALKLCGNYVNSMLAKREAALAGYGESLFVDDAGWVVEGSAENVFLVKNGNVIGVQHPDALPGITRQTLAELTGAQVRAVSIDELRDADEIFLCGTSVEVTGVSRLDKRDLPIGPRTLEIAALYQAVVHGQTAIGREWLSAP
jgi:branched-chain amino acid aminotransferase